MKCVTSFDLTWEIVCEVNQWECNLLSCAKPANLKFVFAMVNVRIKEAVTLRVDFILPLG